MTNNELINRYQLTIVTINGEKALKANNTYGLTQDKLALIKANKAEIIEIIEREIATINAAKEARAMKIDAIEGLKELEDAINAWDNYHYEFERRMENEKLSSISIKKPSCDIAELSALYPRAAAYKKAQSYVNSNNYKRCAAGKKALERIINGDDYIHAIADMDAEWTAAAQESMWN